MAEGQDGRGRHPDRLPLTIRYGYPRLIPHRGRRPGLTREGAPARVASVNFVNFTAPAEARAWLDGHPQAGLQICSRLPNGS